MEKGHIFRRAFHLCGPLVLLYYLMPEIFFRIPRGAWVLIGLFGLLVIEAVRLYTGKVFFGLRPYEGRQISAYAWAGIGVTIGFLLFPMIFVICAVCGLCWVDPVIGEMRRRGMSDFYPALPLALYFTITSACLLLLSDLGWIPILALAIVGSVSAVAIEKQKLPADDDFTMLVIPLLTMTLINEYLQITGLVI